MLCACGTSCTVCGTSLYCMLYVLWTLICMVLIKLLAIYNVQDWMWHCYSVQSNEEEGYVLPTSARKITCQHFDWMLQLSSIQGESEEEWTSIAIYGHALLRIHIMEVKGWWGLLLPVSSSQWTSSSPSRRRRVGANCKKPLKVLKVMLNSGKA